MRCPASEENDWAARAHDRNARICDVSLLGSAQRPDRFETFDQALERIRLEGAIFLRAEYSEAWALEGQGGPFIAGILHPGAERLTFFHVVASGRCWVALPEGERYWASAGEVIVLPYGDSHQMGGAEPAEPVPITSVVTPPPWDELPVIRHGAGGARTDIVCGFLYSEDPLFDPSLRALPPALVVRPPPGPARSWFDASITYALDASAHRTPSSPSTKLPELLLVEILRAYLTGAPATQQGWLAALHDPVLARAMAAIHRAPDRRWTLADLAAEAAVSRSLLDAHFREMLGSSPIRYLTEWRMRAAQELLSRSDHTVASIARRVGYESEEAFSRAFKRIRGNSPAQWRAARRSNVR
jgi:AraC-like DNA-binding protein